MNHTEKRFRRKNSRILLIIIIMILLLLGGVLLIPYQAHHQIGGLSRKPVISLKGDTSLRLYPGEKFSDPGVTAKRNDHLHAEGLRQPGEEDPKGSHGIP